MGAPHTVRWSKSFDFVLKQVFSSFSVTNGKKKEKGGESALFWGKFNHVNCYSFKK